MQNLAISQPQPPLQQPVLRARSALSNAAVPHGCQCEAGDDSDRQFVAMLDAYRDSGGLCRARELQEAMARSTAMGGPGVADLNGWIMQRDVVCFDWQGNAWLPLFQFKRIVMVPHPQLRPVLRELNAVYDAWEIACWFARPNPWLTDSTPVKSLLAHLPAVLHAARAERFIAH